MTETLLVELLTEELPPKALSRLGEAFAAGITQGLQSRALLDEGAVSTAYATPRRLAVSITKVRSSSPDKEVREKVLPVTVALDAEGRATAPLTKKLAALASATGAGEIKLEQLERAQDGKAESLFYRYTARGIDLAQGLQQALEDTMGKLPIPKVMSYQRPDGSTVQFVRPVHKLIALLGQEVLPLSTLGLAAGQSTLGHRFLSQGDIRIASAEDYAGALEQQGRVIASFAERRERIRNELLKAAGEDKILMPEALLDEVTALVEWPVVYACHFDDAFLAVPQECLILTMQTNQKYFALTDASGKLRSRFLIVSNIQAQDARHIITGNERVVRPRLSDAKFFFEQDQKKTLESRLPGLASVVYHNKLGTQEARTQRVKALATAVAEQLGWDKDLAARAALLAKTDLLTDMVGEFPELQGIMGTYYARHDGEADEVARAISEHYQPRFAGDALPQTHAGTVVALADKLETLVGIWGIGLAPTGDKDPFALRRHALGVLRMLVEKRLPLSIAVLLESAASLFAGNANFKDPSAELQAFLMDRLRGLLRERGYAQGQVEAVVAQNPDRLDNVIERLDAVQAFAALPEAESLAAANKRISNILKKTSPAGGAVKSELLSAGAERGLHDALLRLLPQTEEAWARGDFAGTLKSLAQVRNDVDAFFNDVMVMAEDEALRNNRLALLASLHEVMNRVADISKLAA